MTFTENISFPLRKLAWPSCWQFG